ncbi:hypothetical protein ACFFWD_05215 [Bradyrhizobium erythrophlei]|uniref:hypothetical protein n=1 Tax=Bradyrhizobium erythrophlei TaxID=1437360 RepID=UPI0035EB7B1D
MRRSQRLIAAAVAVALCSVLAGCGGGSMANFDPSDLLDFLDSKKKLPGDRKPVFPEGVPGLEQGVPKELYKGAQQDQLNQQNADAAATATAAPPESPKSSKKNAKGKGKPAPAADQAAAPAPDADAAPSEEGAPAALPAEPKPKKIVRRRTTAPPPDQPAQQPAAQSSAQTTQQSAAPFPAPLPSGSFNR